MVADRNQFNSNYINQTSIHFASFLYHSEAFPSHVATKKNGVPALYVCSGKLSTESFRETSIRVNPSHN
jgi:hypothetical protein